MERRRWTDLGSPAAPCHLGPHALPLNLHLSVREVVPLTVFDHEEHLSRIQRQRRGGKDGAGATRVQRFS